MPIPEEKRLPPLDHPDDSLESHLARHSRRGEGVYATTLALLLGGIALLPVLRVEVSVQARGLVRPTTEKHELRVPASGFAAEVHVAEGQDVERGDLLVWLRSVPLETRQALLREQLEEERARFADLSRLEGGVVADPAADLRLTASRLEFRRYQEEREQAATEVEFADRAAERAAELARRELIARSQLEEVQLRRVSARSALARVEQRFQSAWTEASDASRRRLDELLEQEAQLEAELSLYRVRAPVSGTLEELASVSTGSFLRAGDLLAVISPSTPLLAEVYVDPRDVGLLRRGAPARLLIDAFNYSDWGFLRGRIRAVTEDYVLIDGRPMFRVDVDLDGTELRLGSGVTGQLRKGMTLRARFTVAERSLWQLLRDDVNDWLNPAQQPG